MSRVGRCEHRDPVASINQGYSYSLYRGEAIFPEYIHETLGPHHSFGAQSGPVGVLELLAMSDELRIISSVSNGLKDIAERITAGLQESSTASDFADQ